MFRSDRSTGSGFPVDDEVATLEGGATAENAETDETIESSRTAAESFMVRRGKIRKNILNDPRGEVSQSLN